MNVPPFYPGPDHSPRNLNSRQRAERLAGIIMQRWRECGHEVRAWPEPMLPEEYRVSSGAEGGKLWRVETDLLNGLPRKVA